jgi:deoxyribonuclease IV
MQYLEDLPCKIGCHVGKEDVVKTAKELLEVGAKAIQLYLSNKISFNPGSSLSKSDVAEIKKLQKERGLYVVVHGKLILNFCQDDMRNIPALTCDILEASRIDADVIIHQGKNVNKLSREEALTRYVLNVQEAIDQTAGLKTKIVLENSCQQGTELGYNLADLVTIWNLLGAAEVSKVHSEGIEDEETNADDDEVEKPWRLTNYQQRIGFCLDLCHAHVGGMINMRDPDHVTEVLEEFHKKIGLQNLTVIHFNDSEIKFDGHNDSHCDILMGQIGNPDEPIGGNSLGFRKIVEYACSYEIPMILETPGSIPISLQVALIQGWALQEFSLDIEGLYLDKTQDIRNKFSDDPRSRKGRKKVARPKESRSESRSAETNIQNSTTMKAMESIINDKKVKKPLLKIIPIKRITSATVTNPILGNYQGNSECKVCLSSTNQSNGEQK